MAKNTRTRKPREHYKAVRMEYFRTHPESQTIHRLKARAKELGVECTLTREDIKAMLETKVCPILGIPLFVGGGLATWNSPSIDRIDNNLGYTKDNCRCISHRANNLKKDAMSWELVAVALDVAKIELEKEKASREAFVQPVTADQSTAVRISS
jgi:hypothetical protein